MPLSETPRLYGRVRLHGGPRLHSQPRQQLHTGPRLRTYALDGRLLFHGRPRFRAQTFEGRPRLLRPPRLRLQALSWGASRIYGRGADPSRGNFGKPWLYGRLRLHRPPGHHGQPGSAPGLHSLSWSGGLGGGDRMSPLRSTCPTRLDPRGTLAEPTTALSLTPTVCRPGVPPSSIFCPHPSPSVTHPCPGEWVRRRVATRASQLNPLFAHSSSPAVVCNPHDRGAGASPPPRDGAGPPQSTRWRQCTGKPG